MTQNDTTQKDHKNFFFLFDKFSKITLLLEVSFKNLQKKLPNKLEIFFQIFAMIFLKTYEVRKNCVFLCCVILCHLKDTCVFRVILI